MKFNILKIATIVFVFFYTIVLKAQAPSNDACAGAITLTQGNACTLTTGTTQNATDNNETADCVTGTERAVWFKFVAATTSVTITVKGNTGSAFNAVLGVSTGCGSAGFYCGDATGSEAAELVNVTGLTIGTTYYISVHDFDGDIAATSTFTICVARFNNDCSTATPLTPNTSCGIGYGNTASATQSQAGCTGTADDDIWYSFVATATSHTIQTTNISGSSTDIVTQVFSGACGSLVSLVCQDTPNSPVTATGLTVGQTYYFRVYTYWSSDNTQFSVCVISPPPPPSNDDPCGAITLPMGTTCSYTTYTNANATATAGVPAPGCANYLGGDVWFKVTVPASGQLTVDTQTGVMTDSDMAFYTATGGSCPGTPPTLTLLECDDLDSANGLMAYITRTGLTPGATDRKSVV